MHVPLGGGGGVAGSTERAAHQHVPSQQVRQPGFALQGDREVRQWAEGDQRDLTGPSPSGIDDHLDAVAVADGTLRWRQLRVADARRAVRLGRRLERPLEGDLDARRPRRCRYDRPARARRGYWSRPAGPRRCRTRRSPRRPPPPGTRPRTATRGCRRCPCPRRGSAAWWQRIRSWIDASRADTRQPPHRPIGAEPPRPGRARRRDLGGRGQAHVGEPESCGEPGASQRRTERCIEAIDAVHPIGRHDRRQDLHPTPGPDDRRDATERRLVTTEDPAEQ